MNRDELALRLREEGLLAPEAVLPEPAVAARSPWYTRVMLGFAGWLAGMFLVGFFAGTFVLLFKDAVGMLVLSALLIGAAVLIDRKSRGAEVVGQLALALSMAGQAFFVFGLAQLIPGRRDELFVPWAFAGLQVFLFVAMRSYLHRCISAVLGAAAIYYALSKVGHASAAASVLALACACIWAREPRWRVRPEAEAYSALGWGLSLALVAWSLPDLLPGILGRKGSRPLEAAGYGMGLLVYVVAITDGRSIRTRATAIAGALLLAAAAYRAPGISAAALVLLAGLGTGQRALAALGVMGMLGYLGVYYYQIDQTLLTKSAALAVTGAVVLAVRGVMALVLPSPRPSPRGEGEQSPPVSGAGEKSPPPLGGGGGRVAFVIAGLVLVLGAGNYTVWQHERTLGDGELMYLELAPVDPRSLMQGDYMALRFAIAEGARKPEVPSHGRVVVRLDERRIGTFVRVHGGEALALGEALLEYRKRDRGVRIVTDAYFFQEGQAERYAKAKYGEVRARADGQALLVRLRDAKLATLGEPRLGP